MIPLNSRLAGCWGGQPWHQGPRQGGSGPPLPSPPPLEGPPSASSSRGVGGQPAPVRRAWGPGWMGGAGGGAGDRGQRPTYVKLWKLKGHKLKGPLHANWPITILQVPLTHLHEKDFNRVSQSRGRKVCHGIEIFLKDDIWKSPKKCPVSMKSNELAIPKFGGCIKGLTKVVHGLHDVNLSDTNMCHLSARKHPI